MDNSEKTIIEAIKNSNLNVVQELLNVISAEALYHLMVAYGGDTLYIPKIERFTKAERNRCICKSYYSGATYSELAKMYNLSKRQIIEIIDQNRKR